MSLDGINWFPDRQILKMLDDRQKKGERLGYVYGYEDSDSEDSEPQNPYKFLGSTRENYLKPDKYPSENSLDNWLPDQRILKMLKEKRQRKIQADKYIDMSGLSTFEDPGDSYFKDSGFTSFTGFDLLEDSDSEPELQRRYKFMAQTSENNHTTRQTSVSDGLSVPRRVDERLTISPLKGFSSAWRKFRLAIKNC